jgi:hypothetical protein
MQVAPDTAKTPGHLGPGDPSRASARSKLHELVGRRAVGAALVAAASLSLLAFGLLGVGRGTSPAGSVLRPDTQVVYVAGRMWLHGQSPYVLRDFLAVSDPMAGIDHAFVHSGFAYPPTIAPFCLILGFASQAVARDIVTTLNVAAVLVLAYYVYLLAVAAMRDGDSDGSLRFFVPAVVIGNPFTTHIVFQGQTTLVATAALVAAWYYGNARDRPILSGVLFAVATIKPQVALLPVAWTLLQRRPKQLGAMALVGLAMIAVPVMVAGPLGLVQQWRAEIGAYAAIPSNALGFPNVFGVQSLLVASGIAAPGLAVLVLPLIGFLWWARKRLAIDDVLAVLLSGSCLFIYAHDYDLAALAVLYACLWRHGGGSDGRTLAALGLLVLLFAPQRFVRSSNFGPLVHWRELTLMAAATWIVVDALGRSPRLARRRLENEPRLG